ncbi:hypothetical protein Btru_041257 [Bulinus truncatus]|nr:hypothetical protein Btru_041257 [Bulinus truncatus]
MGKVERHCLSASLYRPFFSHESRSTLTSVNCQVNGRRCYGENRLFIYICPPCLKPQSNLEVITVQCSSARDTEILCVDGSYRKSNCSCGAECVRCSVCGVGSKMFQPYQMRSCSQHSDAVCCANADDIIVGDHCTPVPTTTSTTKTTQRITTPPKATDVIEEEAVPMKEISENTGNSAGRGHVFHDILVVLELLTVTLFSYFVFMYKYL